MLLTVLEIALLVGAIILPLRPRKSKQRAGAKLKIDTGTHDSTYAVNKNGKLEKIDKHSLTDHR
ncbi:hypothetical protein [Mucilaginibacter sp. UR6-11]|uniref:hypothetical protein n=1 Tax=Mucilaginibacter sp. UR6-11 TaxID=1435644 RepID=UPI001E5DC5B6|nr:hypothetical protein [Mucilaginibacter sp. UR6-11]MCC8424374.1 hypothetical protein [Mucilaginibacter sp. UR6-11]